MKNIKIENITYNQLKSFVEILKSTNKLYIDFIRARFNSVSHSFEDTIKFFEALSLLKVQNDRIILSRLFEQFLLKDIKNGLIFNEFMLSQLIYSDSPISKNINKYLSCYKQIDNSLIYSPSTKSRLMESNIRNLLMEFGFVEYDRIKDIYSISDKFLSSYPNIFPKHIVSHSELMLLLEKQQCLGAEAEMQILNYEKDRLRDQPVLVDKIEHVSLSNVSAGFDILSYENIPELHGNKRYIEVKAVSIFNFKFNWTINEITKSKEMSDRYYLYLLPVINFKKFDIDSLLIIQNPYINIFNNKEHWCIKETEYCIWKNLE
ncbi:MAG: DUF3883 domain-containing protein [Candidatus Thorarchaeota archaeon]